MSLDEYKVVLPKSGKILKEFKNLLRRRKPQTIKAINKLKKRPADLATQGIEKLKNTEIGTYSIRVSSGDRIIYDINEEKKEVILIRAGKHDIYKLL